MKKNIQQLEAQIGLHFRNRELINTVFIHRSYLNENKNLKLSSNEKLEFLGDSVLSLIVSIYLYNHYQHLKEGDYTDIKAAIVCTDSLAEAARLLNLGSYLYLSRGEDQSGGRSNQNILADCFEALIAAIFLEFKFQKAYQFVIKFLFRDKLKYIIDNHLYLSPKTRLQEIVQAKHKITPHYQVIDQSGPEHNKKFKIAVYILDKLSGIGYGRSKKEAEEMAAKNALEKINII